MSIAQNVCGFLEYDPASSIRAAIYLRDNESYVQDTIIGMTRRPRRRRLDDGNDDSNARGIAHFVSCVSVKSTGVNLVGHYVELIRNRNLIDSKLYSYLSNYFDDNTDPFESLPSLYSSVGHNT